MADAQDKTPMNTEKTEQRIGGTTYIVTSHFKEQGSTAKDKVQRLIDWNTRENRFAPKD